MAIIFALASCLFYGVADVFGTISSRKIGSKNTTMLFYLTSLVILSGFTPLYKIADVALTKYVLLTIFLIGLVGVAANLCFYFGLRKGNATLNGTVASAYPLSTALIASFLLQENVSYAQYLMIGLIVLGIILSGFNLTKIKKDFLYDKGLPYSLATMVLWGVYFSSLKILSVLIGAFWTQYLVMISSSIFMFLVFVFLRENQPIPRNWQDIKFGLLNGILVTLAFAAYLQAIKSQTVFNVIPIVGSSPVVFVILAFIIFKEKLSKQQLLGITLSLLGIVLLTTLSS